MQETPDLSTAVITREAGPKAFETINPSMDTYSIDDIWNLHPDEFQGLLNGVQKKAVQTPDEKNILEYLILQDVARRKALAYANATKFVTQKYAEKFNINAAYPTTTPGISARVQEQQKEIPALYGPPGKITPYCFLWARVADSVTSRRPFSPIL